MPTSTVNAEAQPVLRTDEPKSNLICLYFNFLLLNRIKVNEFWHVGGYGLYSPFHF